MPGCLNQLFEVAADPQNGHTYKMQISRPMCVEFNYYLLFYACFTGISPDCQLSPGKDYIRLKEIQGESDFVFLCLYNEFKLIPYLNPPPNWEGCSPTSWHGLKVLVSIPPPPWRVSWLIIARLNYGHKVRTIYSFYLSWSDCYE